MPGAAEEDVIYFDNVWLGENRVRLINRVGGMQGTLFIGFQTEGRLWQEASCLNQRAVEAGIVGGEASPCALQSQGRKACAPVAELCCVACNNLPRKGLLSNTCW